MMRIIFAGSSEFGLPAIALLAAEHTPVLVLSQPDRPAGRNLRPTRCPVAEFALRKGLPLFQPVDVNDPSSLDVISRLKPDLIVTASYGAMLRKTLRFIPRFGAINLHPSLLPRYRGASPIQSALLSGDDVTGNTIFQLTAKLDAGPILSQRQLAISPQDNFTTLQDKLANLAAEQLLELLGSYGSGEVKALPQDEDKASHTAKFTKSDTLLDWDQPAAAVLNRIRAFALEPGACTLLNDSPLKILDAEITPDPSRNAPGTLQSVIKNTGFTINCRDRQLLVKTVQPAGKKVMDCHAFQLGARLSPGTAFASANTPTREQP
jgi:methionyl-tRNA formyltransferase